MKKCHKKGVLDNLGNLVVGFGYIAVLAAIIFIIVAQTKSQAISQNPCENTTYVYNSTTDLCSPTGNSTGQVSTSNTTLAVKRVQASLSDIPTWFPIIVITLIGGVLLTLVRFFKSGN